MGLRKNICNPVQISGSADENKVAPNKKILTLEATERKCTELGFTKGTEKHGDCVMKLYK